MEATVDIGDWMNIRVYVSHHTENDSIGWYEYWGSIQYDNQPDYEVIDDIEILSGLEEAERKELEKYIDDNWESVCEKLTEKLWS